MERRCGVMYSFLRFRLVRVWSSQSFIACYLLIFKTYTCKINVGRAFRCTGRGVKIFTNSKPITKVYRFLHCAVHSEHLLEIGKSQFWVKMIYVKEMHLNQYNYLKYFIKVAVDSRFSSLMLEKYSVLLRNFFMPFARDRSVIAQNFAMLEMLEYFSARDRSYQKFKIKNAQIDVLAAWFQL